MSTARGGATSSHMREHKLPRRRCRRINPSSGRGSFVAEQIVGWLPRFITWFHSLESTEGLITFTPAPVSKRQFAVYITLAVVPYEILSLYVGLDIKSVLKSSIEKASGTNSCTVASRGCTRRDSVVD